MCWILCWLSNFGARYFLLLLESCYLQLLFQLMTFVLSLGYNIGWYPCQLSNLHNKQGLMSHCPLIKAAQAVWVRVMMFNCNGLYLICSQLMYAPFCLQFICWLPSSAVSYEWNQGSDNRCQLALLELTPNHEAVDPSLDLDIMSLLGVSEEDIFGRDEEYLEAITLRRCTSLKLV